MANEIIPLMRSLYVCDYHIGYQDGKVDLYGIFTAVRPEAYPHDRSHLVLFAQLAGGVGDVPFHFEIRQQSTGEVVRSTRPRSLTFPDRVGVVQMAMTIEGLTFPEPGVYAIDLFCHNVWVCDTTLFLL